MTIDDIRRELDARGWSYADLAARVYMSEGQIKDIMRGKAVLRKTLQSHLELLFEADRRAVLVYDVNLTDKQVLDLTSGKQFPDTPEGRQRMMDALEAVISHNIRRLADYGRACNWTPAERKWLQLDDQPTAQPPSDNDPGDYSQREQKPFA